MNHTTTIECPTSRDAAGQGRHVYDPAAIEPIQSQR